MTVDCLNGNLFRTLLKEKKSEYMHPSKLNMKYKYNKFHWKILVILFISILILKETSIFYKVSRKLNLIIVCTSSREKHR